MALHFIYALVLTQFESSLIPLDWGAVVQEDFPVHVLYCQETKEIVYHNDTQHAECGMDIQNIKTLLAQIGVEAIYDQQVIVLTDGENERCGRDVKNHLL